MFSSDRMSFLRNISPKQPFSKLITSTCCITAMCAALIAQVTPPLHAQPLSSNAPLEEDMPLQAPFVDLSNAMQAYHLVSNWLLDTKVPQNNFELPRINVTNMIGIRVTLRDSGEMVGQGTALRSNIDNLVNKPGQAYDMIPLLALAARDAFTEGKRKLINERIDAVAKGWIEANDRARSFEDVAPSLQIDIQIAHELQDINLTGQSMPNAIYQNFSPGYHGLRIIKPATTTEEAIDSYIWPDEVLSHNLSPHSQITRLLTNIGSPLTDIQTIGQPNGLPFQRFDVIQFVKPQPNLAPVHLVRGNVLLPPHGIGDQDVRNLADNLIEHFQTITTSKDEVRGEYYPSQNLYKPAIASDDQALLASYAILRYHRYLLSQQDNDPITDQLADQASNVVEIIADQFVKPDSEATSVELSLALMGVLQSPRASLMGPTRDGLLRKLNEMANEDGSYRTSADPESPNVRQQSLALIAAAIASTYEQQRTEELRTQTLLVLDNLWDQTQKSLNITTLYWLALAHSRVDDIINPDQDPKLRVALVDREQALGNAIEKLLDLQINVPPRLGPADVVGAFDLYDTPLDSAPDPSWHTSQILALISVGLREPGMKESRDDFSWILSASLAARFIDQLTFKPDSTFYVQRPDQVLGGVRQSLWNNRLAIAPSAMSLLACTELLESLHELKTQTQ
ncbi:hypothetical protein JD969_11845 [Planctomycetota bacterium]|nr:hypothetical protein JD969_11845 [Planctomycetota bacterium]